MDNQVKKCSGCAFADFRYNDAPAGSGYSTFLCTKHNKFRDYGDVDCGEWEDRHKEARVELKRLNGFGNFDKLGGYYDAEDVDDVIAKKDKEISRLKKALYKACANWASSERYTEATWHGDEHREELWANVQAKCRAKAEECK